MTISDLHCDACETFIPGPTGCPGPTGGAGPAGGVRFVYHPGRPQLRDTSGLMCTPCWEQVQTWLGKSGQPRQCAACGQAVTRLSSLHVHQFEQASAWRLCSQHAVEFLNGLRTVQPKLDPATFQFPFADSEQVEPEPASATDVPSESTESRGLGSPQTPS